MNASTIRVTSLLNEIICTPDIKMYLWCYHDENVRGNVNMFILKKAEEHL